MLKRKLLDFLALCFRVIRHPKNYMYGLLQKSIYNYSFLPLYQRILLPYIIWKTSRKKTINVVFLVMNPDMWRYDEVFRRMKEDSRFHPMIVASPRIYNVTTEMLLNEQEAILCYFLPKGYECHKGYDEQLNRWINLRSLGPDIIFYTQPYRWNICRDFDFDKNLYALFCYSPYSFQLSKVDWNWNNPLQNYCWRLYYVNDYHIKVCRELTVVKGRNSIAAGYCLEEELLNIAQNKQQFDNIWHLDNRKRIIWAPHHSIQNEEMFKVSSFLEICNEMVLLREKYKDKVFFAFKPHPILQSKLYKLWGREVTDTYYRSWADSDNSFYAPGDYKSLFLGSDAMIHCSGSFIVEYHYTGKPVQYVYSKARNSPDLGEIGDEALRVHYHAHSIEDIDRFIQQVVIEGNDIMQKARQEFATTYLKSPNGKMFSENVVQDILHELGKA